MAQSLVSHNTVRLPYYAGFTQFALWPSPQLNNSCYGLLDVTSIVSPIKTGQWLDLYFFPGYTYAAYRSTQMNQVPSVTFYDTRPECLAYHSHEFHVMDIKPFEYHSNDISFGSLDEIMTVSSSQVIPQPSDEHSACVSHISNSEVKHSESLKEEMGKIKVDDDEDIKQSPSSKDSIFAEKKAESLLERNEAIVNSNEIKGPRKANKSGESESLSKRSSRIKVSESEQVKQLPPSTTANVIESTMKYEEFNSKSKKTGPFLKESGMVKVEKHEDVKQPAPTNASIVVNKSSQNHKEGKCYRMHEDRKTKWIKVPITSMRDVVQDLDVKKEERMKLSYLWRKHDTKEGILGGVDLTNRFDCLEDEKSHMSTSIEMKENEHFFKTMFTIGSKNIFKIKRTRVNMETRRIKEFENLSLDPRSNIDALETDKKKKIKLACFKTKNKFAVLSENHEEDFKKLIKRFEIITAKKKSLKKCRTCNCKKRHCMLNPDMCSAINQTCSNCKKIGHFPKSLNCQKSRKFKKNCKQLKDNKKSLFQKLSKKNLKLIKIRIKQIEFQIMWQKIINLAEKCAKKFETLEKGPETFMNYCINKSKKEFDINSNLDAENNNLILNILKAYDQMYYSKEKDSVASSTKSNNSEMVTEKLQEQLFDDVKTTETWCSSHSEQIDEYMVLKCPNNNDLCEEDKDEQIDNCFASNTESDDLDEYSDSNSPCLIMNIPQVDGADDEEIEDQDKFAINCESKELIQMINFFRSFDLLWEAANRHTLCSFKQNCFFCHIRSCILKLNKERRMGPKGIKPQELVSQLWQYEEKLFINWRNQLSDVPTFIESTIKLLKLCEPDGDCFRILNGQCEKCRVTVSDEHKLFIDIPGTEILKIKEVSMKNVVDLLIRKLSRSKCCKSNFEAQCATEKIIIIRISFPVNLKILDSFTLGGKVVSYNSHLEETIANQFCAYFRVNGEVCYQNIDGKLCQSNFGLQGNVVILALKFSPKERQNISINKEQFIYEKKVQLCFQRKYQSFMDPDKHALKVSQQREYEMKRNQTEQRKIMFSNRDKTEKRKRFHAEIDKHRDATEERKRFHAEIDRQRDATDERKIFHAEIDRQRDATDERKRFHAEIDRQRNATDERKIFNAEIDRHRDATEERQIMHSNIEKTPKRKAREQTPKRKKMHNIIDRKRNQMPHRKAWLAAYEKTETRKFYVKTRDYTNYQKKIMTTLKTDTGFDVICSSCLQYKSKNYCKSVHTLGAEKISKFIVNKCALLKTRSEDQFVCNLCLKEIKMDKFPKRSHKNSFKYANFPDYLIKNLIRKCQYKKKVSNSSLIMDDENGERQQMQLNRLEAHLLKLCIPFIRVAHCPRGRYLKVKGDLILISSDIGHSLNKILPIQQNLIPVSFKRKLSYSGAYIEEYIEKEKVKMYYCWLKRHNHLFKEIELDQTLIDTFESKSTSNMDEFEDNSEQQNFESRSDEDNEVDFLENYFDQESFEPVKEGNRQNEKTTMFLNKYCEDPELPSVANRLATAIVDYEISRKIPTPDEDDFEIDDEVLTEEQFLEDCNETEKSSDQNENKDSLDDRGKNTDKNEKDELRDQLDTFLNPSEGQTKILSNIAKNRAANISEKMKTISVAPGETGSFQNWGKETFLEEKCFPDKFPYGTGGYLSSTIDNPENGIGFANYCVNQIFSCDPKFRNDSSYIFFLLLVKELIQMKRCKSTYFRQATRLPNMSKNDVINMDPENLSRFNRSYQVFKSLRGTSMYYEESKKNLMAALRQNGCPSLFLTLSCAEYDWPELLKEILETVYRRKVSKEEIDALSNAEKNKLISDNVVQSTVHFQKRIDKMFSLFKYDFFDGSNETYYASSYFYRIEFQQRGAPHVHSLLWLKNKAGKDAPNIWSEEKAEEESSIENRKKRVEEFTDSLMTTSSDDMRCEKHELQNDDVDVIQDCKECKDLKKKVEKYQSHHHTFTCQKKMKSLTIKSNEGHGRLDGKQEGPVLSNITVCRFKFPKFPLDETQLILGIPIDTDETIVKERKKDLDKIRKFLIRQTFTDQDINQLESWEKMQKMNFWDYLYHAGMFDENKSLIDCSDEDRKKAKERYTNAISASVQGTAIVVLKRRVKDIFVNGYNPKIMRLHQANHDLQLCIDQYSCAQYICGYLTKNESGMSKLLKAVNEETNNLKQVDKLNALASVLDKHREVSIQEAIYRLLGLPMTKSSVVIKYLSTIHPNHRDGLLKGNLDELDENDAIFHNSPHEYYVNRPRKSDQKGVQYEPEQMKKNYWENLTLAEFWSEYDVVYGKINQDRSNVLKLLNGKGFIRKRIKSPAILRYYLNYSNDEDLARGLLILFKPFRDEMKEIHCKDVKKLLKKNKDFIEEKRSKFEKYKVMADLITNIQTDIGKNESETDDENIFEDEETTDPKDIDDFEGWARNQATKNLSHFKNLTSLPDISELRLKISSLNPSQRQLFDDFMERMASTDVDEQPVYLYLGGEAGTGKSHLTRLLIEATKVLKIKAGDDLKKPPVLVIAPTANAAYLVGGKTIDSALSFFRMENYRYSQAQPAKMSMMQFQYDEVKVIFCDEISMVGSSKLAKITYRLQDLAEGRNKQNFMGGISFVASGDFWQLPPIKDSMVFDRSKLDGRPKCAPSHWNENFRVYFLTEKMRCQHDPVFSSLCDMVARGNITDEVERYLNSRVQETESENDNDKFKYGHLSIIVTTNPKRNLINEQKLDQLLPNEKEYHCDSTDRITNLPCGNKVPKRLKGNLGKTGNLETELVLKIGAPVVITTNHDKQIYKDDGIMNGARGYVQSIMVSKLDPEKVDLVWVVFNQESIGRRYRFDHSHLLKDHNPGHKLATPIFPTRNNFTEEFGSVEYQRTNFPLSLAYALTAHKCQGQTLDEVVIDFGADTKNKIKNFICSGSFYVALTRVREGCKVFLKSFDKSYIKANTEIEEKVNAMRKFRPYLMKKVYLNEQIFKNNGNEYKIGYLNINGLSVGNHAQYLDSDHNLRNLDILVLSETKLDGSDVFNKTVDALKNWIILGRYDSEDGKKHMGLMVLSNFNSSISNKISNLNHQVVKRDGHLQIQGLIIKLTDELSLGFVYCRSSPSNAEIKAMNKYFNQCTTVMGDFNLSHRHEKDQEKLKALCQDGKFSALNEITRAISNNQLDYILVKNALKIFCFATSFHNFISDHKAIVLRFNLDGNEILDCIKERIFFDSEAHLKSKPCHEDEESISSSQSSEDDRNVHGNLDQTEAKEIKSTSNQVFQRRFENPDMATCWLNSCLQLVLCAMDQDSEDQTFNSELGTELKKLQLNPSGGSLDPTIVKDIIIMSEDIRIATQLSELQANILNQEEFEQRSQLIKSFRLNLGMGQQCVRDFFVALKQNLLDWPDVYNYFAFQMINSTTCSKCGRISQSESIQIYEEMEVPQDQSKLKQSVEEFFNGSTFVDSFCEDGCKFRGVGIRRTELKSTRDSRFIILILSRAIVTVDGIRISTNKVTCTDTVDIRDNSGNTSSYEAISIIEFQGRINEVGDSQGHYICDIQEQTSKCWFRTNDNSYPVRINKDQVTKNAYVVLLKKCN